MAGNWYLGGIQAVNDGTDAWVSGDMRASLIAGSTVTGNSQSWKTVADFTSAGNSLITNAKDALFPSGRLANYSDPANRFQLTWPNQVINLGTPSTGLPYCGILVTDGPTTTPGSTLWGWQRVTGTTQGGAINFGTTASANEMFYLTADTTVSAASCAGFLDGIWYDSADSWNGGSDIYHFALIQNLSSGFNKDWKTVQNALDGGATFCTNCGWNQIQGAGGANPVMIGGNRASATLDLAGSKPYKYPTQTISGGLKWDGALLQSGEYGAGVIGYKIGGSAATSPILTYNEFGPPYLLTTGVDLFWSDFDQGSKTIVEINLLGD